jgi:hypothetical protein
MAVYADLADCSDAAIEVEESNLEYADVQVIAALFGIGIDPTTITLPNHLLTSLAVAEASAQAALLQSSGDGPLMAKHTAWAASAKVLRARLSRAALGVANISAAAGGISSISVDRA